jgi:hypothetical protein
MHGSEVGLLLMKPMEKLTYITVTIDYLYYLPERLGGERGVRVPGL